MAVENIPLTLDKVLEIEHKIDTNIASSEDYEALDFLLSSLSMGGTILKAVKERGYYSYDAYITERKKSDFNKRDVFSESYVNSTIKECINLLINYLQ